MTYLIDMNLSSRSTKYLSDTSTFRLAKQSISYFTKQSSQTKGQNQNHLSSILRKQQFQFDFLFIVQEKFSSLIIKIFLLNTHSQIFKIRSNSQRNFIINSFLKQPNSYQPNIDPSSGFIYFKISYFDCKQWKGGGQNPVKIRSQNILNFFNLQRLIRSAQKLSEYGLKLEDEHLTSSVWNDEKSYLQLSKIVSKLTQNNDLQEILNQKVFEEDEKRLKKANKAEFVKSIEKLILAKPPRQLSMSPLRLQNFVTSLSHDYNQLLSLVKQKTGRSNYDTLLINQSTTKKLNQLMNNLIYRRQSFPKQTFKILEADFGKITLQIQREDQKRFQQKISFLQLLPKQTEYHFLDKYFRSGINVPILLKLSLKDESLTKFLQNNKKTMSLETKMRLMLQTYSAVTILWEQNKIMLYVNKFDNIFVTKNLTVKLRGLESWYRPQQHVLSQEKHQVNIKLVENFMNLTKLYYKIFFHHSLVYVKPSTTASIQLNLMEYCRQKRPLKNLRHLSIMQQGQDGQGLKHFFTGLGYLFSEYVQLARKIIENQKMKAIKPEAFVLFMKQNDCIQNQKQNQQSSMNSERLFNYKHTCSWLFKILQAITKEAD